MFLMIKQHEDGQPSSFCFPFPPLLNNFSVLVDDASEMLALTSANPWQKKERREVIHFSWIITKKTKQFIELLLTKWGCAEDACLCIFTTFVGFQQLAKKEKKERCTGRRLSYLHTQGYKKPPQERLTRQGNPADRQSASASVGGDRGSHIHTHRKMHVFPLKKQKNNIVCCAKAQVSAYLAPFVPWHTHKYRTHGAHQNDVSDGSSPKQLGCCVGIQHHMARMPAARARQGLLPRQLSTRHLREKQTEKLLTATVWWFHSPLGGSFHVKSLTFLSFCLYLFSLLSCFVFLL